jgi:hypothetical protein
MMNREPATGTLMLARARRASTTPDADDLFRTLHRKSFGRMKLSRRLDRAIRATVLHRDKEMPRRLAEGNKRFQQTGRSQLELVGRALKGSRRRTRCGLSLTPRVHDPEKREAAFHATNAKRLRGDHAQSKAKARRRFNQISSRFRLTAKPLARPQRLGPEWRVQHVVIFPSNRPPAEAAPHFNSCSPCAQEAARRCDWPAR